MFLTCNFKFNYIFNNVFCTILRSYVKFNFKYLFLVCKLLQTKTDVCRKIATGKSNKLSLMFLSGTKVYNFNFEFDFMVFKTLNNKRKVLCVVGSRIKGGKKMNA